MILQGWILQNPSLEKKTDNKMSRDIPIENLYYLLCYAYDKLPDQKITSVDAEHCPDSLNLLGLALARSINQLKKRGLERQYLERVEETSRLQGRVLLHESKKRLIDRQGRMVCEFDELSIDCLSNRILKAGCELALRSRALTTRVRQEIRQAQKLFTGVRSIRISESICARVRIHKNNRRYRMPIAICRLLLRSLNPNERSGRREFFDPFMEHQAMAALFEKFVRNFATIHMPWCKVSGRQIPWDGEFDEVSRPHIPIMETDVTLEAEGFKRIIDCKFYKETMVSRYEQLKIRSGHLYQLGAYLRNASAMEGWENVQGQLLYPAIDQNLDLNFKINAFEIKVTSVDLDQHWEVIEEKLLEAISK
jgi:5-methylcytosine-specific restriction enzyme subunit McrC